MGTPACLREGGSRRHGHVALGQNAWVRAIFRSTLEFRLVTLSVAPKTHEIRVQGTKHLEHFSFSQPSAEEVEEVKRNPMDDY